MLNEESVNKDLFVPLPSIDYDKTIEIKSSSENRATVNLFKMECSCKDFISSNRNQFAIGDIRRMCEHLVIAYEKKIGTRKLDKAKSIMIKDGKAIKKSIFYVSSPELSYEIVLAFDTDLPWIDVYAENIKGKYVKHCYNFFEKQWEPKTSFDKDISDSVVKLMLELTSNKNSESEIKENDTSENEISLIDVVYLPIPAENYDNEIIVVDERKKHRVNLHKMTCDCKDYKTEHRGNKEIGDIRRLCLHLRQEYIKIPLFNELDQLKQYLIKNASGDKDNVKILEVTDKIKIAITYDNSRVIDSDDDYEPPRWYNIIALKNNGKYIRYGYNPEREDWSNDKMPELMPELISSLVKNIDLFRDDYSYDDDF